MRPDWHPDTTPAKVWDGLARTNAVSAICYRASPQQFEERGRTEAAYLRELIVSYMALSEATVLDIGGGIGRIARYLGPDVKEYVLLDISDEMLRRAKKRLRSDGGVEKFRFLKGTGTDLGGVVDQTVDFAFSCLVLQHCDREVAVRYLRELARVLKPGGRAWIQMQPMAYPERFEDGDRGDWPANLRRWYPGELLEVCLRCGLSVLAADCDAIEILVGPAPKAAWLKRGT